MIATLRFDTSNPDDGAKFRRASAADDLCAVLWDIGEWMRHETKYGGKDYSAVSERLAELMIDHDIDLDALWS